MDDLLEYATNDDKTVMLQNVYKTALNCNLKNSISGYDGYQKAQERNEQQTGVSIWLRI